MDLKPYGDYILGRAVKTDSGVVTTTSVEDTFQKYEVLAVGSGIYSDRQNSYITPDVNVGDIVFVQKHAEADTPQELKDQELALFQTSRVMAVKEKK